MTEDIIDTIPQNNKQLKKQKNKKFSPDEIQYFSDMKRFLLKRPHKESKIFSDITYNIDTNFIQNIHEQIIEISKSYSNRLIGTPIIDHATLLNN